MRTSRGWAQRIITIHGAHDPISKSLAASLDKPVELRAKLEAIKSARTAADKIQAEAHAFTFRVYTAALKFYYAHHDQPEALARFIEQLEGGAK
jgi:hypothetical protein